MAPHPARTGQPNIVLESPKEGALLLGTSFVVRGKSRTFENGIAYKLLGADGRVVSSGHGMSRGSMGQFGPFEFHVPTEKYTGPAVLEVFDFSAKDGSEIDKVRLNLILKTDTVGIGAADRLPLR